MKNFALIGAAGYIAPRHLQAIKDTGNRLVAAVDPNDSVGILDRYFPDASFFTEVERFDRHLEKLRRGPEDERVDLVSICTPNHLHDAHIRLALRVGACAICEKPLVLNPWNLDTLEKLEEEYGCKVKTILQLRVHPELIALKTRIQNPVSRIPASTSKARRAVSSIQKHKVKLTYITSRGLWYHFSWKGVKEKSGGIATNIGVHFFDLLIWLFGNVVDSNVIINEYNKMSGTLELENADVEWFLSIDRNDLPAAAIENKKTTFRAIFVDDNEVQFSEGFTDLHTKVYEETLAGRGFGIKDARPSIDLVSKLREAPIRNNSGYYQEFVKNMQK